MKPQEISNNIADSIPKEFQEAFARVVQAGMKIMFSEDTHDIMIQELQKEGDISENIGNGIAALMSLLYEKSNGTMPQEVIIPAGIYLLSKGAEFIEEVTGQDITPNIISEATDILVEKLVGAAGVPPDKFRQGFETAAQDAGGEQEQGEQSEQEEENPQGGGLLSTAGAPDEEQEEDNG